MGHSYRDLRVWQRSTDLVAAVYRLTQTFPKEELYGLTNQLRRAAVSVSSNIAEGQGRTSSKEFHHFLGQARGSLLELETQLVISVKLGYANQERVDVLLEESGAVHGMLNRLMDSLWQTAGPRKTA